MRVTDKEARNWYMQEAAKQMWAVKTLNRNINTQYYERMLLSQMSSDVEKEMKIKTNEYQHDKFEFIKNPAVLEFMGLPGNKGYTEQKIEQAIIDNMENFLLEMGKGFALVARQQLIRTTTEDYYVDLVFYNYILKCFVLIDLKSTKSIIKMLDKWICMSKCMMNFVVQKMTIPRLVSCFVLKQMKILPDILF